jgi:putative membrane protein
MADAADRFEIQPNVGNHFAWVRTVLALQRTLMAAVRTSVSLIGFGFTVAQFFQRLQGNVPEGLAVMGPEVPRNVGLVLIAAGVVSLAMFTLRYHSAIAYFRSGPFAAIAATAEKPLHRPTYLVAWTVMLIGVMAFASVFVRF